MIRLILFLLLLPAYIAYGQSPAAQHYHKAKEAYEKQDFQSFLFHTSIADSISPNHPTLTYNLAAAHALTGAYRVALDLLEKAVLMDTRLYPVDDPDFDDIRKLPAFEKITALKQLLDTPVKHSETAFTHSEKDLHPEAIAYDHVTRTFLLGSIHKKKIISYHISSGKTTEWKKTGEDGLWAVMGMRVDKENNWLWVCTTATAEMLGYTPDLKGKTAVYKYDLKSKKLIERYCQLPIK